MGGLTSDGINKKDGEKRLALEPRSGSIVQRTKATIHYSTHLSPL